MSIILVAASMLSVSPLNVRKTQNEAANLQLRASIVARQRVFQNLVAIPVPRKKGRYEVTAGGRRLSQVHAAIAAGDLPENFEVPVLVLGDRDEAQTVSLEENLQRESLNPADECTSFRHIIEREGKTPADVAKRLGVTERFVLGRLRLAALADIVFDALRDGEITLDVAMAYAATSDTTQQTAVYERNKVSSYAINADTIRRQVSEAGYAGTNPRALLVGRETYQNAGGRIDGDLFSDAAGETWLDRALLDRLYDEKVQSTLDAATTEYGYGSARWAENEQAIWSVTRGLCAIKPSASKLTAEAQKRKAVIEDEKAALVDAAAGRKEALTDEDRQILENLNVELSQLEEAAPDYTDREKSEAIVVIYQGRDGQLYSHPELYREQPSGSAIAEPARPVEDAPLVTKPDDAAIVSGPIVPDTIAAPADRGLTDRHARELAQQKAELLAIHIANDPHFALDIAVFVMADKALAGAGAVSSELRADAPVYLPDFKTETQASAEWDRLTGLLDSSWTTARDPGDRFDAFCALSDEARAAWLGWCVARTITPVKHGDPGSSFTDHLGAQMEIDVAAWWRPNGINYFDRVSKPAILSAFRAVGGTELSQRYAASKKTDLAAAAERLFRGDTIVEADTKTKALAWLPREMAFTPPASEQVSDQAPSPGSSGAGARPDEMAAPANEDSGASDIAA